MIPTSFIASYILTVIIIMKKRSLKKQGRDKEMLYHLLRSSLEFLVPFNIVLLFYAGLLVFVMQAWEYLSLQSLIRLDAYFTTVRSYVSKLKLSESAVLLAFLMIYALILLRIPFEKRKRLYPVVARFHTWVKRLYTVFVLLCTFTLLGTQLGEPSNNLKLRIKSTRDGYADVRKQTQEAISEEVASKIYTNVHNSFPLSYQTALMLPDKIAHQSNSLRDFYAKAQSEYKIKCSEAESVLTTIAERHKSVSGIQAEIQGIGEVHDNGSKNIDPDLRQVSYRRIKEVKAAIEEYRQRANSKFITFLNTEEGKKLVLQAPKIVTEKLRLEIFRPWIESYPIVEPIIDVFFGTVDEKIQMELQQTVDAATKSLIQNPNQVHTIVNGEASRISAQAKVKISPEILNKADKASKLLEQKLADLDNAKIQIDNKIKEAENIKVRELFVQLANSDASIRENAALSLSKMGDKLGETQVNELISIMRNGNEEWSEFLYRSGHCSWYKYTSIKYYAATALADMKSRHVSNELVLETRKCKEDSKTERRITDPGWICY
jgi:hypothetical protein